MILSKVRGCYDFPAVFMQEGFESFDLFFGCDNPTCNPSFVRELSLLTQFSGISILHSWIAIEALQWARPKVLLSLRNDFPAVFMQEGFESFDLFFGCDNPTCNPSFVRELSLLTQFSGISILHTWVAIEALQWG